MTAPAKAKCSLCWEPDARVIRFSLIRSVNLPDGKHTTRGAGCIVLCQPCWRKVTNESRLKRAPRRKVPA